MNPCYFLIGRNLHVASFFRLITPVWTDTVLFFWPTYLEIDEISPPFVSRWPWSC